MIRFLVAFIVLAAAPFFLGDYHNDVYRKMLLWIALALGYNFLFGICGQVAFSHFAFYGIGAYSVVILLFQLSVPLPLAILLGIPPQRFILVMETVLLGSGLTMLMLAFL